MDGVKVSGKFWLRRDYVHPLVWVLPIQVCVHTGKTQRIAVLRSLTQIVIGPWTFARPDREDVMFVVAGALKARC